MDKIVVFEIFYNPIEANIVKSRLIDAGVQCFLSDENTITINPLYTQALGGVKLHLFEGDIERAKSILQEEGVQAALDQVLEDDFEAEAQEAPNLKVCPNCGSASVGYVQATKRRFGILTVVISFLLMIYPFSVKKTNHCFDCAYEFQ